MVKILSRAEARALGLKRYFTGKPCSRGHMAERFVSRMCCECSKENWLVYSKANRASLNAKARARYKVNPQKERERAKQFRIIRPECTKANNKKWSTENPERRKQINFAWAERNRAALAERERKRRIANPEKIKESTRNTRAKRGSSIGFHTQKDIADILHLQRKRCAMPTCRASLAKGYHVDHIVPLARGGSNDRRNLQVLCPTCNTRKGATDPIEFAQRLGLLL